MSLIRNIVGILLFVLVPSSVPAQDLECKPSPFDAPELVILSDADIQHVRLELAVDPARASTSGRAIVTLRTSPVDADSVRLLTGGARVEQVLSRDLDEALPSRSFSPDTLSIDLSALRDSDLVARESVTLELSLSDIPGVQYVDGFAWTIDPLLLGGSWFPWSGDPADRFTSELVITTPGEILVSAAGMRLAERETEEGESTFLFSTSEPHSARSLLFAAGPFVPGTAAGNVDVIHPGSLASNPGAVARDALREMESRLGSTYPYGRLMVVVVPGAAPAIAGTGILIVSERTLGDLRSTSAASAVGEIATGVAQQWLGGVVSPATYEEIWMTAGMSAYLAAVVVGNTVGESAFHARMRRLADAYWREAEQYRRPLSWPHAEHPVDLLDTHAKSKAAWVAHTIREEIGDEAFWKVLDLLVTRNQFEPVDADDFTQALEAVTGVRHASMIDHWIHAAGHPELASSYFTENDTLFVTIEQQQVGADVPEVFELDLGIEVGTLSGSEQFDVTLDELRQTFGLPFASEPRYVAIDPAARYLVEMKMEQSLSAWIAQLRNASTARARLAAATAVARRRGDPAVLIGLRSALTSEQDPHVKSAILHVISELSDTDAAERAIVSAFEDTSAVVRIAALQALSAYGGRGQIEQLALRAANNDPVDAVQAEAVDLLGRVGSKEALDVARAALITPSVNAVILRAGLRVLGMLSEAHGAEALEAAATYAQPEQPLLVRLEAVDLLERLAPRHRRAENLLLNLLVAPDWQLRLAAAGALTRLGNDEAVRAKAAEEPVQWVRFHMNRLLTC